MEAVKWSPIKPLVEDSIDVDFAEINGLHQQWREIKANVEESNPTAYDQFKEELFRSWAIETGIIEGLYELDRGITQTLIQRGFASEYVEMNSSNRPPEELISILRDHRGAIDHINTWIEESRPLTKWFVQSLHQAITKNQPTYQAVNQFGVSFEAELHRGEFKRLPNNPTRLDGVVHEYCPPEQVVSELDNLLDSYNSYDHSKHPLAVAAWLHHTFTQIHPFEDGNGRVVRALLTWHLVKEDFLPAVVTRDLRAEYIATLEKADAGNLSPLVQLLIRLERRTLLDALSVEHGQLPSVDTIDEVVGFIVDGFQKKRKEDEAKLRSVQGIAVELRDYASELLHDETERLCQQLGDRTQMEITPRISVGGPEESNEYYYRQEVIETAKAAGHWVNPQEPRYFVRVTLRVSHTRIPVMVFVISLHSVGRQLTGVMAATSFMKYRYWSQDDREDDVDHGNDPDLQVCNPDPFLVTVSNDASSLKHAFERWVRHSFSVALRKWGGTVVEQA